MKKYPITTTIILAALSACHFSAAATESDLSSLSKVGEQTAQRDQAARSTPQEDKFIEPSYTRRETEAEKERRMRRIIRQKERNDGDRNYRWGRRGRPHRRY